MRSCSVNVDTYLGSRESCRETIEDTVESTDSSSVLVGRTVAVTELREAIMPTTRASLVEDGGDGGDGKDGVEGGMGLNFRVFLEIVGGKRLSARK